MSETEVVPTVSELVAMVQHTSARPIVRFALARLAEDEKSADEWHNKVDCELDQLEEFGICSCHGEARERRRVEAGCRILWGSMMCSDGETCPGLDLALAIMVEVWSDHPDYDSRWQGADW